MIWNGIDVGAILTYILETVLALAVPALVAGAFVLGSKGLDLLREHVWSKLNAEQQATVEAIARVAVNMAEQIASRDDVKDAARQKFNMANAFMDAQLRRYGITLTAEEVEAQIEAAVRQHLNNPPQAALDAVTVTPAPPATPAA